MATFGLADDYITVSEAARRKGVSRAAVYQAIREERLPHTKISRTTVLARRDVDAWKPRSRRGPPSEPGNVWDIIADLGRGVQPGEWEKAPRDGSVNVDHYLYGAPRIEG